MKYLNIISILTLFQLILISQVNTLGLNASIPNFMFSFQKLDDSYQYREDQYDARMEGIKPHRNQQVSSDKIVMLSAVAETDISIPTSMPVMMKLGLFTNKKMPISINISNRAKRYYVDPVQKNRGPGLSSFKWPTQIMRKHKISIDGLYARATFLEKGKRILFPVFLYHNNLPNSIQKYHFIFAPLKRMQLKYWILDAKTESFIVNGMNQRANESKAYLIDWDCRDSNGTEVSEGIYIIKISGIYADRMGRTRTVTVSYQFYHKPELQK